MPASRISSTGSSSFSQTRVGVPRMPVARASPASGYASWPSALAPVSDSTSCRVLYLADRNVQPAESQESTLDFHDSRSSGLTTRVVGGCSNCRQGSCELVAVYPRQFADLFTVDVADIHVRRKTTEVLLLHHPPPFCSLLLASATGRSSSTPGPSWPNHTGGGRESRHQSGRGTTTPCSDVTHTGLAMVEPTPGVGWQARRWDGGA